MLDIDSVSASYGNIQILWNVSLSVKKGEIVTVLGPNGAGKTTLVKTILGLLHPNSGNIKFSGERIDKLPTYKIVDMGIVLVPEGREIFPKMTVYENLLLGAYTKTAEKNKDQSLETIFQIFPVLRERRKQLAQTLSGGEQQMLAIGRGLMSKPKLLIMDEPSLGLAPILVQKIFNAMREINEKGVTLLLVEQNVHRALEIANRGYLLEAGKMVLAGDWDELLANEHVKKAYLGL
ncbi:MAG: ABC transporter ATP-binding protein [archaeon]|nr:ABC transporter ATP-binding protein [archaeon]MCP8319570.1 ABC transporter ATP-binding protein [archaeon]